MSSCDRPEGVRDFHSVIQMDMLNEFYTAKI